MSVTNVASFSECGVFHTTIVCSFIHLCNQSDINERLSAVRKMTETRFEMRDVPTQKLLSK